MCSANHKLIFQHFLDNIKFYRCFVQWKKFLSVKKGVCWCPLLAGDYADDPHSADPDQRGGGWARGLPAPQQPVPGEYFRWKISNWSFLFSGLKHLYLINLLGNIHPFPCRWPMPSSSCPPGRRRRDSCCATQRSSASMTEAATSPPASRFSLSSSWSSSSLWPPVGQVETNTNTQMPTNVFLSKMIFLIDGLPNENMLSMRIMQAFYCCLGKSCS